MMEYKNKGDLSGQYPVYIHKFVNFTARSEPWSTCRINESIPLIELKRIDRNFITKQLITRIDQNFITKQLIARIDRNFITKLIYRSNLIETLSLTNLLLKFD
jgi:hypothetical protein